MKNTFKWMFAAILLCGLTIASCTKDPEPTPEPDPTPEPQTVTRIASEKMTVTSGMMVMKTGAYYTWDNGVLTSVSDTIDMGFFTQAYKSNMFYEDGLLVRMDEENGRWQNNYTYEDGLMMTFLHLSDGDTTSWGTINSYTDDGLVKEYVSYEVTQSIRKKTIWTITWENGDAVEVVENVVEPEDLAATYTYNYTYDDKPCIFTGNPLGNAIQDGSGQMVARRQSKHNQIEEGNIYNYNEEGYVTSIIMESDTAYYEYVKQTLR